jgi:hypothetical protein
MSSNRARLITQSFFNNRRQYQHYYLFNDLRHTFQRDRYQVVSHYQINKHPQAFALLKDVLPYLTEQDRYKLAMENIGLVACADDAYDLFTKIFSTEINDTNREMRRNLAEAILPVLKHGTHCISYAF